VLELPLEGTTGASYTYEPGGSPFYADRYYQWHAPNSLNLKNMSTTSSCDDSGSGHVLGPIGEVGEIGVVSGGVSPSHKLRKGATPATNSPAHRQTDPLLASPTVNGVRTRHVKRWKWGQWIEEDVHETVYQDPSVMAIQVGAGSSSSGRASPHSPPSLPLSASHSSPYSPPSSASLPSASFSFSAADISSSGGGSSGSGSGSRPSSRPSSGSPPAVGAASTFSLSPTLQQHQQHRAGSRGPVLKPRKSRPNSGPWASPSDLPLEGADLVLPSIVVGGVGGRTGASGRQLQQQQQQHQERQQQQHHLSSNQECLE
jgi:hypothetical protein